MRFRVDKKGFTLIETLVYIAIVSGILIMATSFAWNIINSRTKAFAMQEVEQNGRFIMKKITSATREAISINSPPISGTDSSLSLRMENQLLDVTNFILIGGKIQMQQMGTGFVDLNSDNVIATDLEFTNLSSLDARTMNVEVSFIIEHVNPENHSEWDFTESFNTTIELRDR